MPSRVYAAKFLQLARKAPEDPAAVESLFWICDRFSNGPELAGALELLLRDHADRSRIGPECLLLQYCYDSGTAKLLRTLVAKNPHAESRGWAALTLAIYLQRMSEWMHRFRQFPAKAKKYPYDPAFVKWWQEGDPAMLTKEAEELCELAIAKYPDFKDPRRKQTMGEMAQKVLFSVRHLTIGKIVPEIEGEDIESQKLKLSDYRGKVVLLDFRGHW